MAGLFYLPNELERKGSLYLRSDHMNYYSRPTLNSNWHQAREAEPKDYDITTAEKKDLCKATYVRIGDATDGKDFPETTYQEHSQQIHRCKDLLETKDPSKRMVTLETFPDAKIDNRDTGAPEKGYEAILPGHHPEHNKRRLETTHEADYTPPYPIIALDEKELAAKKAKDEEIEKAKTACYKRFQSQFSDTMNHQRSGWNTWQDESGVYGNTQAKRQMFTMTKTITAAYE